MAQMLYWNEARTLKALAQKYPVVVITGPRGNSKPRLVKSLFPSKDYIDLGNENILKLAQKSFKTFLLAFSHGAIINEANRIPGLVDAIRYYVDKWGYEPGRYLLISSKEIDITNLQDRGICLTVQSPSVEDLDKALLLTENPFLTIQKGQYPAVLDGRITYSDLLENCFRKDFSRHINHSNLALFQKFLRLCATYSALSFSMNRIARELEVSAPTIKTWLGILQTYHLVTLLRAKDTSDVKLFFNDSGLACHLLDIGTKEKLILSPYREQIVQTYAFSELLKGRHSKTLEPELYESDFCDFTACWKTPYAVFVDPNIEITDVVLKAAKSCKDSRFKPIILYLGDVTFSKGKIDCIGYRDWTKFASGIDYFS